MAWIAFPGAPVGAVGGPDGLESPPGQNENCWFLLRDPERAPTAARRLLALREELIAEIDAARWQVPAEVLTRDRKGG